MSEEQVKSYATDEVTVLWDARRCIHSGKCLQAQPGVFDGSARPWIDPTKAAPEAVAAAVRLCPSGALHYAGPAVPAEQPDEPTTIVARPNGPLWVRGRLEVKGHGEQTRVALCRCGASANKPFCDNSHLAIGFRG